MKRFLGFVKESISWLDSLSEEIVDDILFKISAGQTADSLKFSLAYISPIKFQVTVDFAKSSLDPEFLDEPWELINLRRSGIMVDATTEIDHNVSINISIAVNDTWQDSDLHDHLLDVLRHEIEHVVSHTNGKTSNQPTHDSYRYFLHPDEIQPMITGLRLKARHKGIHIKQAMIDYLIPFVKCGFMTDLQMKAVLAHWLKATAY